MADKTKTKKLMGHVGKISLIIAVLFLTFYLITILAKSSEYYSDSATKNAKISFDKDMINISTLVDEHYENLYEVVDLVRHARTTDEVIEIMTSYIGSDQFGELRYYCKGVAYSASGAIIDDEASGHDMIDELAQGNKVGCTDIYRDSNVQLDCIAFFIPVRGSEFVDGILSIVPARNIIQVDDIMQEGTSMVAIVGAKGNIYARQVADGFTTGAVENIYDFLEDFTASKTMTDNIRMLLNEDELTTTEIQSAGVGYTVVAEPIEAFGGYLHLITFSKSDSLIMTEVNYIRHIVNILLFAIIGFIVGLVFVFLFQKKAKDALTTANLKDATLECANIEGFRREAMNLTHGSDKRYAVCVSSIRQFHFVQDKFGAETSDKLLRFIVDVLKSFCTKNETFGYAGDGKFLILVEYSSESAFRDKILLLENVINKFDVLVQNRVKIRLATGICLGFGPKKRTISEMIDCATIVCEDAKNDVATPYVIYVENVREKINRSEQIEAQMEHALDNNEFRLFLQPKYNVATDSIDSAEALVRWFDHRKGDYIYPVEFIGLFETNGFIVKMDHFIYLEVLKYISEAREKNEKIVPISVNVSRVTASKDDFVNFYVGNKRKYMIDDDLIKLEFTETFAVEDYTKLAEIVKQLQEGGIRCSIDDFGVGYSSFRVLKELTMDELKLDRVFLSKGVDVQRDEKIISTIISLANEMGMTVVQEGVETKEMFDRVSRLGINVIQGYYYAKAIPLEEFKIFIKSNTSIRYKSIVK